MKDKSAFKSVLISISCLLFLSGCFSFSGGPRARIGYLPTATGGILFPDPNKLGSHSYGFDFFTETGGIVYTCRGGHVDLDHVRGNADNTRWLIKKIRKTLSKKGKGFSFNLTGEVSSHKIRFTYPANWDTLPNKKQIIDQIAYDIAPLLSYNATIWHEIQTWFGVHFVLIEPEFNSAFSWEDVYSNLIGVTVGAEAVKDTQHRFNEAVTIALNRQLKELLVQPKSVAWAASDKMRGKWYTGDLVPNMKMRNFDIGLRDGYVTPTVVPGLAQCPGTQPMPLAVPSTDTLEKYGLTMTHVIKPNHLFQQGKMFKAAGSKKITPEESYPAMIEFMKKEAAKRGDTYVD
ncbi:MAG: DUF4056 domain-containing protein [Phycisphaerae bacterium]|nr:DUF4056 domain-containing protein [Phycisphaerae bacterium]